MLIFAKRFGIIIYVFFGGMDYDSFRDGRTETLAQQSPKETAGIERCKASRFSTFRFTPSVAFCYNTVIVFFNSPTHKLTHSMKKLLLSSIAAIAAATAAFGWNELVVFSGVIYMPEHDGAFSAENVGTNAHFFACVVDEGTYLRYVNNPEGLYRTYCDGTFDEADEKRLGHTNEDGFYRGILIDELSADTYYVAMIASYTPIGDTRTYYIAKVKSGEYTEDDEEHFKDLRIDLNPTEWSYIDSAPPAPLEIECTNIAVSGGTVTVTYQVSDLSGFAVGGTVNFSVAYSLARNASGALATETLSGTINSIDATASTFTATLSPPANTTSLFILGIDD